MKFGDDMEECPVKSDELMKVLMGPLLLAASLRLPV